MTVAEVNIVCRLCGNQAVVPERQIAKSYDRRCRPCRAKHARQVRSDMRAAGIKPKRDQEHAREYELARSADPSVRARRAADMSRYAKDPKLRFRHKARWQVRREIAAGRLCREPCEVCSAPVTHAHHDDYGKPLDVRWLCAECHREWHKRNMPIYPDARVQGVQS